MEKQIEKLLSQLFVELNKAQYLCEAPYWQQSRRYDVAALLGGCKNTVRELEKLLCPNKPQTNRKTKASS